MDIVERLRREEDALDNEAADEIERLREVLAVAQNTFANLGYYNIAEKVGSMMDKTTAEWIAARENKIKEQADEIERLREALKEYDCGCSEKWWAECSEPCCGVTAIRALQQKETE